MEKKHELLFLNIKNLKIRFKNESEMAKTSIAANVFSSSVAAVNLFL